MSNLFFPSPWARNVKQNWFDWNVGVTWEIYTAAGYQESGGVFYNLKTRSKPTTTIRNTLLHYFFALTWPFASMVGGT